MSTDIHPTAIIHADAELGSGVSVGPYAVIDANTQIGDGCRIDPFAQIKSFTSMGKDNHIHSYACIGGDPQDLKFGGEQTWLRMGEGNTVREYVTLNRGTEGGGGATIIGSRCLLMAYVHVAHDCVIGDESIFSNGATLGGHVQIGAHAVVGGLSAVHQFVRIGDYAFVGGKTGVVQDVPPFMLAAGERAKLHGPNLVGLRRMNFSSESIQALKNTYRTLWRSGMKKQEALAEAQEKFGNVPEALQVIEFVKKSDRGITPSV